MPACMFSHTVVAAQNTFYSNLKMCVVSPEQEIWVMLQYLLLAVASKIFPGFPFSLYVLGFLQSRVSFLLCTDEKADVFHVAAREAGFWDFVNCYFISISGEEGSWAFLGLSCRIFVQSLVRALWAPPCGCWAQVQNWELISSPSPAHVGSSAASNVAGDEPGGRDHPEGPNRSKRGWDQEHNWRQATTHMQGVHPRTTAGVQNSCGTTGSGTGDPRLSWNGSLGHGQGCRKVQGGAGQGQ